MWVPQGSILGLTLFSVYINDVALAEGDSLIHLYADNTTLYTSGPSLDTVLTNLQTSFDVIQHSFRGLQLLLNAGKTKCMLFNLSLQCKLLNCNYFTTIGLFIALPPYLICTHCIQTCLLCYWLYICLSNQIVFVTYTWLADVNGHIHMVSRCYCECSEMLVFLVPTMQ